MSAPTAFGPYFFSFTDDEVRIAASRIALRGDLSKRFERDHVAPLVAFILLLVFAAVLAFSGLLGRRFAEAALLLGAIAFISSRLLSHLRLHRAHRSSLVFVRGIGDGADIRLVVDDEGASLASAKAARRCPFEAGLRIENAGGMIYLWPRIGEPVPIPSRAFADQDEVERFVAFARRRIADRGASPTPS